jgi:hypothetical protein
MISLLPAIADMPAPDKDFTWQALLLGAALLSVASTAVTIWVALRGQRTQVTPQPLEVRAAQDWATRQSVDQLGERVDANHEDSLRRIAALDETRRTSVSKVYDFTRQTLAEGRKEQREDVAALRSEIRADLRGINERLNDISEAVGGTRGELKRVPGSHNT